MSKPRVLVIDDSDASRELMKRVLGEAGFIVFTLPSPIGATREITQSCIDTVVIDIHMPSLRGDRLAQLFRSNPQFAHLKVILVSGTAGSALSQLADEAGADAFLEKRNVAALLPQVIKRLARATAS